MAMTMELTPGAQSGPPRGGPAVDLDPNGVVAGKGPDRQRRQLSITRAIASIRSSGDCLQMSSVRRQLRHSISSGRRTREGAGERVELRHRRTKDVVVAFHAGYPQEFVDLVGQLVCMD
jgi:hypothetical protein